MSILTDINLDFDKLKLFIKKKDRINGFEKATLVYTISLFFSYFLYNNISYLLIDFKLPILAGIFLLLVLFIIVPCFILDLFSKFIPFNGKIIQSLNKSRLEKFTIDYPILTRKNALLNIEKYLSTAKEDDIEFINHYCLGATYHHFTNNINRFYSHYLTHKALSNQTNIKELAILIDDINEDKTLYKIDKNQTIFNLLENYINYETREDFTLNKLFFMKITQQYITSENDKKIIMHKVKNKISPSVEQNLENEILLMESKCNTKKTHKVQVI